MKKMLSGICAALALGVVLPAAHAADVTVAAGAEQGKVAAAERITVSATVTAVDAAKRIVKFKGEEGRDFEVVAGPDVKNFNQIKVGDVLKVSFTEALALELKKHNSGIRERREIVVPATAQEGQAPAAALGRKVVVVANVVNVDRQAQTVTLQGVEQTRTLKVNDPQILSNIKVGDQVQATFVEAVALEMVPVR